MEEVVVQEEPQKREMVASAKRVVVKVGSSSLTREDGHLDVDALTRLVDLLAERRAAGTQVLLVTSGAAAAGRGLLGLPGRPKDIATAQATAAVGQGILVAHYSHAFGVHGLRVGQVLLTADYTMRRVHHRNAQQSLERLLDLGIVPIVNENDALATKELQFGDNDRLAALVAHLVRADAMVLLTDIDGLYDGPPSQPGTKRIPEVRSPEDVKGIEVTARGSDVGTGGMVTKLESVALATASGIPVIVTSAEEARKALEGEETGTWFPAYGKRISTRRLWLAHSAPTQGHLLLDDGAVRAILGGKASLLPAGILAVEGEFKAGDPVEIGGEDGRVIAHGFVNFDAAELPELIGHRTDQLVEARGDLYGRTVVHRDDLVLIDRKPRKKTVRKGKKNGKKLHTDDCDCECAKPAKV